jgi:hypothetical protein
MAGDGNSNLSVALAAVVAFPLLPGFQSPAFQGIFVFLGLLISLGSSAVIANLLISDPDD